MHSSFQFAASVFTGLAIFAGSSDAFWRLPCRGATGVARVDPLMDPGSIAYHAHAVHGSGSFGDTATLESLLGSDCTSCAVTQDKSAYWHPALYFIHSNGSAELVPEDGGMLVYYLLFGDNVQAFPEGFRMIAGDSFERNFPWPVPDPPKSEWTGDQISQKALSQKAVGFNCLNYAQAPEASLYRHFLPNKTYLDEHCTDGVRFEMMFPSCWNGKDLDSDDHKSHMAYPSLVMDGTCPEGFETRLVSLFFETIWATYKFKGQDGEFVISNGDPTGYGYHGDFIFGWEPGVLEEAVKTCTSDSGMIEDCPVFNIQSEDDQRKCKFEVPEALKLENVFMHDGGLPGNVLVEYGPEYAFPIKYNNGGSSASAPSPSLSVDIDLDLNLGGFVQKLDASTSSSTPSAAPTFAAPTSTYVPTSTSTSTYTPTPTTAYIEGAVTQQVIYVEQEVIVLVDEAGNPVNTQIAGIETVSSAWTTVTRTVSTVVTVPTAPVKRGHSHGHRRRHGH